MTDPVGIDGPAVTAWFAEHVPEAVAPLSFASCTTCLNDSRFPCQSSRCVPSAFHSQFSLKKMRTSCGSSAFTFASRSGSVSDGGFVIDA